MKPKGSPRDPTMGRTRPAHAKVIRVLPRENVDDIKIWTFGLQSSAIRANSNSFPECTGEDSLSTPTN